MKNLNYPIDLTFKITTLSNDFTAKDATGVTVAYVRQKMLKLIEEIQVFSNENRSEAIYTIKANKWLDFNTTYTFINQMGNDTGRVVRKGWASIWRAHYEIYDENQLQDLLISEENPWVKVSDSMLDEIPFLGLLSGYLFHPSYSVSRPNGSLVARLKKQSSFFGRRFTIEKLGELKKGEEERILLGLMMMILLERRRG
mgnify:CR=1 FL=1